MPSRQGSGTASGAGEIIPPVCIGGEVVAVLGLCRIGVLLALGSPPATRDVHNRSGGGGLTCRRGRWRRIAPGEGHLRGFGIPSREARHNPRIVDPPFHPRERTHVTTNTQRWKRGWLLPV